MQRGLSSQVALGYALKTLKRLKMMDGEATMVPRQAALRGGGFKPWPSLTAKRYSLTLAI